MSETTLESNFITERKVISRPTEFENVSTATYDDFINIYPESYFIQNYVELRLIEEKIILSKKEQLTLTKKITTQLKKNDLFDAMLYFADFLAKKRTNK